MKEKQNVEKLLLEGQTVMIPVTGLSMYPFLIGGRDRVILSPLREGQAFRKGEVLLYRRKSENRLILHRVVRVREEGLFFTGDNQTEIEGPLPKEEMLGRMTGFVRKGKEHTTAYFPYRFCTGLWRVFLPMRPAAWGFLRGVRRIFGKEQ